MGMQRSDDMKSGIERYHRQFLGGRNCTRITVPIITTEQILKAAETFRHLADELERVAMNGGTQVGKILEARSLCGHASTELKGGIDYKGAR